MKKEQKNNELDFLYSSNKENNKKRAEKKSAPKNKSPKKQKKEEFDLENEIVIGMTNPQVKKSKKQNNKNKNNKTKYTKKSNKKENIKKIHTIKWIFLFISLICAIVLFLMSPVFDIVEVKVINEEQISKDTIISLSNIKIGENIFKYSKKQVTKNIKENQYVDSVKIQRKLPNIIEISIKERKTTFMIEYPNMYAYISNQGYILELKAEKIDVPKIIGSTTGENDLKVGGRINKEDLNKLEVILKIMEAANSNEIDSFITSIDITDQQDYTLLFETKGKKAYIGSGNNLNDRMRYIKVILEKEEGIEGEIFVNGDLNKDKVYFREKV